MTYRFIACYVQPNRKGGYDNATANSRTYSQPSGYRGRDRDDTVCHLFHGSRMGLITSILN